MTIGHRNAVPASDPTPRLQTAVPTASKLPDAAGRRDRVLRVRGLRQLDRARHARVRSHP